ncbi:MAG: hypothetical protein LBE78_02165 [Burkholderiaceae bacterium]|nr:hypothetical protein [Burkholderiaceae bacterium]
MKNAASGDSRVIVPVVERHVGDAAFYWSQLDRAAHSPLLGLQGLLHFEKLLTAHLEGIEEAAETGWHIALGALRRWHDAGELFVCAWLVFRLKPGQQADSRWHEMTQVLATDPDRMLRGLVAAVLRMPPHVADYWVSRLLQPVQPTMLQVAAWRAVARRPRQTGSLQQKRIAELWESAAHSSNAYLRAAACRAAVGIGHARQVADLLSDVDRAVCAEAGITTAQAGETEPGLRALWLALWGLAGELHQMSGAYRAQAEHRLARWTRHLGTLVPHGHGAVVELLTLLPTRMALALVLQHGDDRHLPWVRSHLSNPGCARMAGWVWASLLGVDLELLGLAHPPSRAQEQTHLPTDDLDPGLPLPDAKAIENFDVARIDPAYRLTNRLKTVEGCLDMLEHEPQALRSIAAGHLTRLNAEQSGGMVFFDTRADARQQSHWINAIKARRAELEDTRGHS